MVTIVKPQERKISPTGNCQLTFSVSLSLFFVLLCKNVVIKENLKENISCLLTFFQELPFMCVCTCMYFCCCVVPPTWLPTCFVEFIFIHYAWRILLNGGQKRKTIFICTRCAASRHECTSEAKNIYREKEEKNSLVVEFPAFIK